MATASQRRPCPTREDYASFCQDHLAFSRDYFTEPVICGQERLENQFPQVYNLAEWSRTFLNKCPELNNKKGFYLREGFQPWTHQPPSGWPARPSMLS